MVNTAAAIAALSEAQAIAQNISHARGDAILLTKFERGEAVYSRSLAVTTIWLSRGATIAVTGGMINELDAHGGTTFAGRCA